MPSTARPHPLFLKSLLEELPSEVRTLVDTTVFARGDELEQTVARSAAITGAHVVAYDHRITGQGRPLCATVAQANLDRGQLAALRSVEREMPPWIVLVAYARPAELRHPISSPVTVGRWS